MPPLYPFFLYLLNFLNPLPSHFVDVVLYVHLTLSLIAIIYILIKYYKFFIAKKLANRDSHICIISAVYLLMFTNIIHQPTDISLNFIFL